MSNQLATFNPGMLPAAVQQAMSTMTASELSQNVGANYAVISLRGKVFRIKFGGAETPIMMTVDGAQVPAPFIDVIIPRANGDLSKTYYKAAYAEGDDSNPDCWSEDGVHPLAPEAQRPLYNGAPCQDCRLCPANQWGSKITPQGKQARLCADTRKVALVPLTNPANEAFNGPMLLRVPGASLGPLAEFDRAMTAKGIPYFAVAVRIGFDQTVAFPKLTFQPLRVITQAESDVIMPMRADPRTDMVIAAQQVSAPPVAQPSTQPAAAEVYHQPPQAQPTPQPQFTAPAPAPEPTPQPQFTAPAPQAQPTFAPPQETVAPQPQFTAPAAAPPAAAPMQFGQPTVAPAAPPTQQPTAAPATAAPSFGTPAAAAPAAAAPATSPQGGDAPPPSDALLSQVNNLLGF